MTFAQIVSRVVATTGRADKQADIEATVNGEMLAIQREHNLYFMEEVVGRMVVVDQHKYALPTDFKDWGDVALLEHRGDVRPGGAVEALSDSAADTNQNVTINYVDYVGDLREETQALVGVTPVPFTGGMAQLISVTLSAVCAGTVVICKVSAGATLAVLLPGETTATFGISLDSVPLEGPRTEGFLLADYNLLDTGAPERFSDDRGELRVWPPRPDEADRWSLRLRYYKYLPELSGSQTNELTLRWADLVEARATAKFYITLPQGAKEAVEWNKRVDHPRKGMPGLIRVSNQRRLTDFSLLRKELTHQRTRGRTAGYPFWGR